MHYIFARIGVCLAVLCAIVWTSTTTASQPVAPALMSTSSQPYEVIEDSKNYVLKFNLKDARVHPLVMLANNDQGGREAIRDGSSYTQRLANSNHTFWAVINADFIGNLCPSGVNCAQGLTYIGGTHKENWTGYGTTWPVRGSMGFDTSNGVEMNIGSQQTKKHMTVAAGPMIVQGGGAPKCSGSYASGKTSFETGEQFDGDVRSWCSDTRAISFLSYSADGQYLFMGISKGGQTVLQAANWLKAQGAHQILRLDSGGSSKIIANGRYIGGDGSEANRALPNAFAIYVTPDGTSPSPTDPPCPDPKMRAPGQSQIVSSRAVTFRWEVPSGECSDRPLILRAKSVPDMNGGGGEIFTTSLSSTADSHTYTFDSQWEGKEIYWSVWRERSGTGPQAAQVFRISSNQPPQVAVTQANGQPVTSNGQTIWSNTTSWNITGTAGDTDGRVARVVLSCSGDSCQRTGLAATGTNTWQYTFAGIEGRNRVSVQSFDHQNAGSTLFEINLAVDRAAPATRISFNNESTPAYWPAWFSRPVEVRLQALDQGTRSATAGVREIRYQVDNGPEQITGIDATNVVVSGDGAHTIQFYAIDKVGNSEPKRSVSFKIDQTPPTPITGTREINGIPNNQWQDRNMPIFAWDASTDSGSGLSRYEFYFGPDLSGTAIHKAVRAAEPRQWIPQSDGLATGTYYLRGRAVDNAGATTAWSTLYTIRFDGTPPPNPSTVTHSDGVASNIRQDRTSKPDFSWPTPGDDGVGIKGYYIYWGDDPQGISTTFISQPRFVQTASLCLATASCTGYLRIRSVDQLDRLAYAWTTVFVLRYDTYLGPRSTTYRQPSAATSAGAGLATSSSYLSHATIGQVVSSQPTSSSNYKIVSGYEPFRQQASPIGALGASVSAAPSCLTPTIAINNGSTFTNNTAVTLNLCASQAVEMQISNDSSFTNAQWEPFTTTKPWVLANTDVPSTPRVVYALFRDADGTIHRTFFDDILYDSVQPSGTISVDTHDVRMVSITAQDNFSGVEQMQLSTTPAFTDSVWEDLIASKRWTPPATPPVTTLYLRFRDGAGNISQPVTAPVDVQPPTGSIALSQSELGPKRRALEAILEAHDTTSPASDLSMRIDTDADLADVPWQPYTTTITLPVSLDGSPQSRLSVQYRDTAGNVSPVYSVPYLIDLMPPQLDAEVTSSNGITGTLSIIAFDDLTAVAQLHMSNDPLFQEQVVTIPSTHTAEWVFDQRKVAWIKAEDVVGNMSVPYPVDAGTQDLHHIYVPFALR